MLVVAVVVRSQQATLLVLVELAVVARAVIKALPQLLVLPIQEEVAVGAAAHQSKMVQQAALALSS